MITANLTGFAALQKRLEALSKEEATKAGQIANRAGASILRKEVIKKAPNSPKTTEGEERKRSTKSGGQRTEKHKKIVNNVRIKKVKSTEESTIHHAVAIMGAYHANFIEFGSIHNTADPFMRDALDAAQQPLIDAIAKVLNKQLIRRGA